jgi:hypothetical protein
VFYFPFLFSLFYLFLLFLCDRRNHFDYIMNNVSAIFRESTVFSSLSSDFSSSSRYAPSFSFQYYPSFTFSSSSRMKDRSVFASQVIQYCFQQFSTDLVSPSPLFISSSAVSVSVDNERFLLLMKDMMEELLQSIDHTQALPHHHIHLSSIILVLGEILNLIPLLIRSSPSRASSNVNIYSSADRRAGRITKRASFLCGKLSCFIHPSSVANSSLSSSTTTTFFQRITTTLKPLTTGEEQLSLQQKEKDIPCRNPIISSLVEFNRSLTVVANRELPSTVDVSVAKNDHTGVLFLEEIEDEVGDADKPAAKGEMSSIPALSVFSKDLFEKIQQRLLYLFSFSSIREDINSSLSLQRSILFFLAILSSQNFILYSLTAFRPLVYSAAKCLLQKLEEFHALFRLRIFSQYLFSGSSMAKIKMRALQRLEFEEEDRLKVKLLLYRDQPTPQGSLLSSFNPSSSTASSSQSTESTSNSMVTVIDSLFLRLSLLPDIYSFFSLCLVIDTSFLSHQLCGSLLPEIMKTLIVFTKVFLCLPSAFCTSKAVEQEQTRNIFMSKFYLHEQLKLSFLSFLLSCCRQNDMQFAKIVTSLSGKYDIVKSLLFYLLIFLCDNEVNDALLPSGFICIALLSLVFVSSVSIV